VTKARPWNLTPCAKRFARTAIVIAMIATCVGLLLTRRVSFSVHAGLLPTANDPFLDGSNRSLQTATWHLGNGTRTWGETVGLKLRRAYLTVQIKHTNPTVSVIDAHDDE
jgi:hypothetical protein